MTAILDTQGTSAVKLDLAGSRRLAEVNGERAARAVRVATPQSDAFPDAARGLGVRHLYTATHQQEHA